MKLVKNMHPLFRALFFFSLCTLYACAEDESPEAGECYPISAEDHDDDDDGHGHDHEHEHEDGDDHDHEDGNDHAKADDDDHEHDDDDHDDHDDGHDHSQDGQELITDVILTFTPDGGGDAVVARFDDPVGASTEPNVDTITLSASSTYTLSIQILNETDPDDVEDVTDEILAEDDEHQFFFTGSGIQSEATGSVENPLAIFTYGDEDSLERPVGLNDTSVSTQSAGTGTLTLRLQHLPGLNGCAQKTPDLADDFAEDGATSLPGDADVNITFDFVVE